MSKQARTEAYALDYAAFVGASRKLALLAALVVFSQFLPQDAGAQGGERGGKDVADAVCAACHGTGANGAPKIGDRAAWIPRAAQGLDAVVRSAIKGHGGMPARGGMPDLTDAEMRKATIYMLNQGTGPAK